MSRRLHETAAGYQATGAGLGSIQEPFLGAGAAREHSGAVRAGSTSAAPSAPRGDDDLRVEDAAIDKEKLGGIRILQPNAGSREEVASIVNNYRDGVIGADGNGLAEPDNHTRSWSASDYLCGLSLAWLLCCRCYTNSPTSVYFTSDFQGHVTADTAVLGMVTNLVHSKLGGLDLQSLDARNNYARYGNVHIMFVPQGQYAKVIIDNKYYFLDAGWHVFAATQFHNEGLTPTSAAVIQHGNTYIFNVVAGQVVVVSDTSKRQTPIEVLALGQEVRTSYNLRHELLNVATRQMPVREEVVTSDNYKLGIEGFISFKIKDPSALVAEVGFQERLQAYVDKLIQQLVQAAFNNAASRAAYRSTIQHNLEVGAGEESVAEARPRSAARLAGAESRGAEGEADKVKSQIHDDIARELKAKLGQLGIECTGVHFTKFMPDQKTVEMLEANNQRVLAGMAGVEAAHLEQLALNQKAEGDAHRLEAMARGSAAARAIEARAEAEAVKTVAAAYEAHPDYAHVLGAQRIAAALGDRVTLFAGGANGSVAEVTLAALASRRPGAAPSSGGNGE